MDMFISFAPNEIIGQQSDPENIRDKSVFLDAGQSHRIAHKVERRHRVRSSEETRGFFNVLLWVAVMIYSPV